VRIPASWCGTVGLKPSYGLISTRGVVPLSYRLDHVGTLTRTVEDAAVMLNVLAGFDPECPESRHGPAEYRIPKPGRLDGVKLGVLDNFSAVPQDLETSAAFHAALEHFTGLGAEVRSIAIPTYDAVKGRRAGFVRLEVEAAFVHRDLYKREPERFSPQMRLHLDYGAKVSAIELMRTDRHIDVAAFELMRCFEDVDAIVSPTTPQAAPAFSDKPPDDAGTYCIPANFAGVPAISVPIGRNTLGLPLGLQVMGSMHQDARVLEIAAAFEAASGFRYFPPPPLGPATGSS
jgi:aspartyl-tRNA(Asn)/glutamyl-tRNA(Gln) amidotransferase subunit A